MFSTDSIKKNLEYGGRGYCIQNIMGDFVQGDFVWGDFVVGGILSRGILS